MKRVTPSACSSSRAYRISSKAAWVSRISGQRREESVLLGVLVPQGFTILVAGSRQLRGLGSVHNPGTGRGHREDSRVDITVIAKLLVCINGPSGRGKSGRVAAHVVESFPIGQLPSISLYSSLSGVAHLASKREGENDDARQCGLLWRGVLAGEGAVKQIPKKMMMMDERCSCCW